MAIAVGAQWLFNGIVANSFPVINRGEFNEQQFNGALPYFIFAFFCVVAFFFVLRYMSETKGKSLEEIEKIWQKYARHREVIALAMLWLFEKHV